MSTIALPHPDKLPLRTRVAADIALPLGVMNCVGAVVFWEWSVWTFVAVIAAVMGATTVLAAAGTLRRRAGAVVLLRRVMLAQIAFTASKIIVWQEEEATLFGLVAIGLLLLLRERER